MGESETNLSLYELFFDLTVNVCERFPALDPLTIRRSNGHEVFLMLSRLYDYNEREKKNKKKDQTTAKQFVVMPEIIGFK